MKFYTCLALLMTSIASVSAHTTMKYPLPRGHPLNPNAATKDYNCLSAPLNGGAGCAPKAFPCGGYPQDTTVTQVFNAGDVISVQFWNPNFPNGPQPSDATANQARHNGGQCEFALSYDGGVTYTVIATYHQTCPDIFFDWKVKIPDAAPSCDNPGKCLFSWSWINAVGNREFYQNCADIKIVGKSTKPLPIMDITRANLPPQFPNTITPPGDPANTGNAKGSGPLDSDTSANLAMNIGGSGGSSSSSDSGSGTPASGTTTSVTSTPTTTLSATVGTPTTTSSATESSTSTTSTATESTSTTISSATEPTDTTEPTNASSPAPAVKSSTSNTTPQASNNPLASNGSSCKNEGKDYCIDSGKSSSYNTCDNGLVVTRQCPGGTVCITAGGSVECGRSSRKF